MSQRDVTTPAATTEVTVACSYCDALVTVAFRHGAVMPLRERETGVAVFVPTLTGGDHKCPSDRHRREREWWGRGIGRYLPDAAPDLTSAS